MGSFYSSSYSYCVYSYTFCSYSYTCRYVVDGTWLVDPTKEVVVDEMGRENNVVTVEDRVTRTIVQVGAVSFFSNPRSPAV